MPHSTVFDCEPHSTCVPVDGQCHCGKLNTELFVICSAFFKFHLSALALRETFKVNLITLNAEASAVKLVTI